VFPQAEVAAAAVRSGGWGSLVRDEIEIKGRVPTKLLTRERVSLRDEMSFVLEHDCLTSFRRKTETSPKDAMRC
jgi:hypothetical protein